MLHDAKDINSSTTAIATEAAPDNKTRRYDRQLRLWAASGQSALESSRILVISGTATSTSILKNLVLPGIGHFTILDPAKVTPEDAGNNFFLEGSDSIGKFRAEEAVRLLLELNDGVDGNADLKGLDEIIDSERGKEWLSEFSLVIAHNLEQKVTEKLSHWLWQDSTRPPLVVVRSAGFLAEFYIQYHEHAVIESHPETAQSLQIDKPFPALLKYATSLDFENMDVTDHGHVPFVIILVRVLEEWKKAHVGNPPSSYEDKKEFKKEILAMRKKIDAENFEEAESQAYRAWTPSKVPSDIHALFSDPQVTNVTPTSAPFYHLVHALSRFVEEQPSKTLPLTSTLPDMKSSTDAYIQLQNMYKQRAEEEKEILKGYLKVPVDADMVDAFVKNSHALKLLRGKRYGQAEENKVAFAENLQTSPKAYAIHLALSALSSFASKQQQGAPLTPTEEVLTSEAQALLPPGADLPHEFADAVGEAIRTPTADLPNVAALLGGLVAQEVIKVITKQYIPINGYCVVDMIDMSTAVLG
ncbi:hypothetical protein CPB83DRAFT_848913 [Crepidotus variabilis]|uniref:NEDD8-activating enzyme E1 regulatory subunit n=1 Tax=Crepidotus variabilis TaxID=179855 RepID=A0A9P6ELK6_9AGAR|nr:hypothetical protein CPB83DRAFT_848913 [Crepidotus variabilis]